MANKWGHCKDCKHFDSRAHKPSDRDQAQCVHPDLEGFELRLSGASGCNVFEARMERERPRPSP